MSLKDLLPDGAYEEILEDAHLKSTNPKQKGDKLMVKCPTCGKTVEYSTANEFRPFCSMRCKYLDLGAWAEEKRSIPGKQITEDDDADLLNSANLDKREN